VAKTKDTTSKTMRVLFVAAEADPIIKVGGLGDVTGTLPRTLRALEPAKAMGYHLDIRLAIPLHAAIKERFQDLAPVAVFDVPHPDGPIPAQAFLTHEGDLPVYLIAGDPIPDDAPVYSLDTRKDGEKFTFFSLAVLELARALDWPPDILHANDWHTALSVYTLKQIRETDPFFANTRSILTVHNLPFMGAGTAEALKDYGIPELVDDRLPPWGSYQPLPMGLASADYLTTVSPTYAREILTPEFGCGLQDFLQLRASTVTGILNGLDETGWDPAADAALAQTYNQETLDQRMENKLALLREFGLPPNLEQPLLILSAGWIIKRGRSGNRGAASGIRASLASGTAGHRRSCPGGCGPPIRS
jgi:starch synthase